MQKDSSEWFLGSVKWDVKEHFTRLHPIATISPDLKVEEIGDDLTERFPMRGDVSWFHAPLGMRGHTLVEFRAEPNPKFDPARGPDEFEVREFRVSVEAFSLPWFESQLRNALNADGVPLPRSPAGPCVLNVMEGRWFGPLVLVENKPGLWRLRPDGELLEAVPVFDEPPNMARVRIDGEMRTVLIMAGSEIIAPRVANLQLDIDVLNSVLRRLRKLDISRFNKLGLTYAAFEAYVEAVANADLLPGQLAIERARAERVKELSAKLELGPKLIEEIMVELQKFDPIKLRLAERVGELVEERKHEIDAHLIRAKSELDRLQVEIVNAGTERADLVKLIESQKKQAVSDLLTIDEAMRDKVRDLREAPGRAVAELLSSSALFRVLLRGDEPSGGEAKILSSAVDPNCVVVHDLSAVRESVAGEFIGAGVALESMFALLAAFVAGLTPICSGDAAQEALRAVARAVCGGNAWWLPVSPVTTSLQDVLAPASKQPGLGVGGPGDVLEAALQRPDELVLAVLESVDLAPTDCFVPPLLEFAQISPNTRSGRVPMMARDGIGVCAWPRNMLLAFTITRSLTSLRMPRRVAELAPLLNFDWTSISLETALAARNLVRVAVAPWREVQITAEPLTAIEDSRPSQSVLLCIASRLGSTKLGWRSGRIPQTHGR